MTGQLPGSVCIGGVRCGTPTLWVMLQRHRGMVLPETREMQFFDSEDDRRLSAWLGRDLH